MSYMKNKKNRLKTKYMNILFKDFGIIMSASPTEMIVICNGGLCNGITHEMVSQTFQSFQGMPSVFMVPGKSYSFVKFTDSASSQKAYNQINDQELWPEIKGPIHLGYVKDFNLAVLKQGVIFKTPPGLLLIHDFITQEEEDFILNLVGFPSESDSDTESHKNNSSQLKHRKVKHFGFEFRYSSNDVDLSQPIHDIPRELNFLWERLSTSEHSINFQPDQLTINSYEPGQGIPPHVDTHSAFEDGIYLLSLGCSIVMEFSNGRGLSYSVLLPRASLCIMLEESRYDWTHGITPRKSDLVLTDEGNLTVVNRGRRISLTFRKTRNGDCTCTFPRFCDTVSKSLSPRVENLNLGKQAACRLEDSYVHEVYSQIASHFSETRHKPWPNVTKFVNSFGAGSVLVDVGCGNGKYFSRQSKRYELGCDSTMELIRVCRQRGFETFSCNCLNLPLRDNTADGCICIAVIHHLTTQERRQRALDEIVRILRKGGRALIYVWAKNQEAQGQKSSYLKQNYRKKGSANCQMEKIPLETCEGRLVLPVHNNRTNFDHNDLLVPWKLKTKGPKSTDSPEESPVYLRFYHVYDDDELEKMCSGMEGVKVVEYYHDQGNWCVILEKL